MIDWGAEVLGPCLDVFGEPVTYTPAAGTPFQVTAIFDNAYHKDTLFEDGPGVINQSPTLGIRLSDFAATPDQNDRVFVPSVNATYLVREVHLDGHGGARLMLNKVSSP